jgi:hypothetical protein
LLLAGVILPLAAIIFELSTQSSSDVLFDPMPTWWHLLLLALVPVTNLLTALHLHPQRPVPTRWLVHGNAFALGISAIYALLYLPFTPFAVVALCFFLVGLIPLAPAIVFFTTLDARKLIMRAARATTPVRFPLAPGLIAATLALAIPFAWDMATLVLLHRANAPDTQTAQQAIHQLRLFGNERFLLEQCYQSPRFAWQWISGPKLSGVPMKSAREVYYRVTGESYNMRPAPRPFSLNHNRGWLLQRWDGGHGGDAVAGRIAGLTMAQSGVEGKIDVASSSAYFEWTITFKNEGNDPAEARAQMLLPPGGVASRVSLWINGEERDAAFGRREQVKAAYREVAVQQRRDPLLVTSAGPDRILIQCFPVPARGGEMKMRIGITAPGRIGPDKRAFFLLPTIVETNFDHSPWFRHELIVNSNEPVSFRASRGAKTHHLRLDDHTLQRMAGFQTEARAATTELWTEDPGHSEFLIRQRIIAQPRPVPERLAIVIDGSREMKRHMTGISSALREASSPTETRIFFAGESVETPASEVDRDRWLATRNVIGGRDNIPALRAALDFAAGTETGSVLWIHGSQPMASDNLPELLPRLHSARGVTLHDFAVGAAGPNRIVEGLERFNRYYNERFNASPDDDVRRLFAEWNRTVPRFAIARERIARPPSNNGLTSQNTGGHVARLWGRQEVNQLIESGGEGMLDRAIKLGLDLQLITPATGAVVLETKEQYDRHQLAAIDPATAPAIPEPTSVVFTAMALAALASMRSTFRRRCNSFAR